MAELTATAHSSEIAECDFLGLLCAPGSRFPASAASAPTESSGAYAEVVGELPASVVDAPSPLLLWSESLCVPGMSWPGFAFIH